MEIIESEEQKQKRLKRSKPNLRDLCNTMKWSNIGILGAPEGKRGKGGRGEKITEEKMAKNVPNLMEDLKTNIQEAQ